MLNPGACIGPYEIVGRLGAGGMGEVYRGRDLRLKRDVAIKILPGAFASDRDRAARFEREARTLATLNHPHIAQIYAGDDAGGRHPGYSLVHVAGTGERPSGRSSRRHLGVRVRAGGDADGTHAFSADTVGETLAGVIEREPDLSALPPRTPPAVRSLIARTLERDPTRRLRDIDAGERPSSKCSPGPMSQLLLERTVPNLKTQGMTITVLHFLYS